MNQEDHGGPVSLPWEHNVNEKMCTIRYNILPVFLITVLLCCAVKLLELVFDSVQDRTQNHWNMNNKTK